MVVNGKKLGANKQAPIVLSLNTVSDWLGNIFSICLTKDQILQEFETADILQWLTSWRLQIPIA